MALGIVEPKTHERPPGTELLVDDDEDAQRDQHHVQGIMRLKHGMGKVRYLPFESTTRGTFFFSFGFGFG